MQKLDDYVKLAEAAQILGVAENTLRAWADSGKVPMHRNPINGYRLFKRTDLDSLPKQIAKSPSAPLPRKAR